jgi:hypothetical protein
MDRTRAIPGVLVPAQLNTRRLNNEARNRRDLLSLVWMLGRRFRSLTDTDPGSSLKLLAGNGPEADGFINCFSHQLHLDRFDAAKIQRAEKASRNKKSRC